MLLALLAVEDPTSTTIAETAEGFWPDFGQTALVAGVIAALVTVAMGYWLAPRQERILDGARRLRELQRALAQARLRAHGIEGVVGTDDLRLSAVTSALEAVRDARNMLAFLEQLELPKHVAVNCIR